MQVTMIADLLKSAGSSESYKIWKETEGGLEEKMTANFMHALKTYWREYLPKSRPSFPSGFEQDHDVYLNMNDLPKKSEAWKAILAKYSGYFSALHGVEAENISNLYFLKEARSHFEKIGMIDYAGRVKQLIDKHGVAA
jgi:hypothetical protein